LGQVLSDRTESLKVSAFSAEIQDSPRLQALSDWAKRLVPALLRLNAGLWLRTAFFLPTPGLMLRKSTASKSALQRRLVPEASDGGMFHDVPTVDGRNPTPVDRWFIPLFIGFQPSKVVQDFFHQQ